MLGDRRAPKARQEGVKRILWVTDAPTPYNEFLFNAIAADERFSLWVHYSRLRQGTHPWRQTFGQRYRWSAGRHLRPLCLQFAIAIARARRRGGTLVVVAGWRRLTFLSALAVLMLSKGSYSIWTDTPRERLERNRLRRTLRNRWVKLVLDRATFVMGTGVQALTVLHRMGARQSSLVNFPYWVPLPETTSSPSELGPGDPLIFLSIGRIDNSLKGHDIALHALVAAKVASGQDFEYRICGSGPDARQLEELADQLGVGNRLKVLGWLEACDVEREILAATAILHPSPTHEPYGVAVLEAMAQGRPVFASNATCAAQDRIVDGVNGRVHLAGSTHELAAQLVECIRVPNEFARMGCNAAKTAREWPVAIALDILNSLVGGSD